MDRKLVVAILFNVAIALILVLVPLIPRGPDFEVEIEPETVPLNSDYVVRVIFHDVPTSFSLEITEGIGRAVVEGLQFQEVEEEVEIDLSAEEGKYRVGLHLARVTAEYPRGTVEIEAPFPVTTGGNLSVQSQAIPARIETIGNESGTGQVTVTVLNELGEPATNATVWFSATGFVRIDPNVTVTDEVGQARGAIVAPAGNYTDVIEIIVAKRGHPLGNSSIEVEVIQRPG